MRLHFWVVGILVHSNTTIKVRYRKKILREFSHSFLFLFCVHVKQRRSEIVFDEKMSAVYTWAFQSCGHVYRISLRESALKNACEMRDVQKTNANPVRGLHSYIPSSVFVKLRKVTCNSSDRICIQIDWKLLTLSCWKSCPHPDVCKVQVVILVHTNGFSRGPLVTSCVFPSMAWNLRHLWFLISAEKRVTFSSVQRSTWGPKAACAWLWTNSAFSSFHSAVLIGWCLNFVWKCIKLSLVQRTSLPKEVFASIEQIDTQTLV